MIRRSSRRGLRAVCLAVSLTAVSAPPASALTLLDKLDAALREVVENPLAGLSRARVIVSAKPGQLGSLLLTLRLGGFTILAEHPSIEAVTLDVPRVAVTTLALLNLVQSISLDAPTRAVWDESTPSSRLLGTLGHESAYTGSGVGVAVIDSGIAPVPAFQGRLSSFYDFTATGKPVAKAAFDDYGHGTHVAGLIGGSPTPSNGMYGGVAPGVRLVGLKVLDKNGAGYTSHVISAVEFVAKNRTSLGVNVINLSLGHPIYERAVTDPLVRIVEYAVRRGLVVVVSAGNYGVDSATGRIATAGITSPANAPSAITVGSIDTKDSITRVDDEVAPYSSRGPTWYDGFSKPDLVAPGHALTAAVSADSSLWRNHPSLRASSSGTGHYMRLSGTSMAAAVASGVVALTLEAHRQSSPTTLPSLTPNAVKAVLQFTALPLKGDGTSVASDQLAQGAGSVNAAGATDLAKRLDTKKAVGDWWLTMGVTASSQIGGETWSWSEYLIWDNHLVWGDTVYVNQRAFAVAIAWDSHIVWGDHVMFGEETVWRTDRSWNTHIVWGDTNIGRSDGEHIVWGDTTFTEGTVVWGNLATSKAVPMNTFGGASLSP